MRKGEVIHFPVPLPPCLGCDLCGHVYDGRQDELFVLTSWGQNWLCRRCYGQR